MQQRQEWKELQSLLNPEKLVFIDEAGLTTKMTRLRGRSLKGQRCLASVPHGHWKITAFVGAPRSTGMTAPVVFDALMNGPAFKACVEQARVAGLSAGDTVIMDNLPHTMWKEQGRQSQARIASFFTFRLAVLI